MARPIWTGTISFGLVSIPVSLVPAENRRELSFHMLDGRDMSAIHNKRVNESTGEEVPYDEIVKGYEHEPGSWVVVDEEDFKAADVKATQTVDIIDFVKERDVEPIYFERPYYVIPAKGGAKGYALLREALVRSGYLGVAKVVIRTRQHLAGIIARGPLLVLELMHWAHEIKDTDDIELPDEDIEAVGATDKELTMAQQLIEAMVEDWDPERYKDTYRNDLLALIERKVESGEVAAVAAEPAPEAGQGAGVVDIMALLKASIDEAHSSDSSAAAGD